MDGGIFLIQSSGDLVEMKEQPYDTEAVLQELLAKYPNLLAGDQMDVEAPRRWLLISREMGVPCEEDGGDRWSLDHLFLDQDAIPTLVEVKRRSDTRIRREVVGQMLDYAANAVVYWPVEVIRARFEEGCSQRGIDPLKEIEALAGPEASVEAFWQRVKTNLQAGRIRMVFVADVIPPELRRIVEFLNRQMDPAEVLAVEIKQFVGQGLKTLVPRVIGQTVEAERKKGGSREKKWDEASYFADARQKLSSTDLQAVQAFYARCRQINFNISWGTGKDSGSLGVTEPSISPKSLLNVRSNGILQLNFGQLNGSVAVEKARDRFKELVAQKTGLNLPDDYSRRWPNYPIADWSSKAEPLADALKDLLADFRGAAP